MFYELRQYRTKPGQRENWVNYMEEVIMPFQISKGMVIAGSFVSEEERIRLYEAVYESDTWKNEIAPKVPEMLQRDKSVITRIEATPKSVLQ